MIFQLLLRQKLIQILRILVHVFYLYPPFASFLAVGQGAWVNLCTEYPDSCCFTDGSRSGAEIDSTYWVIRSSRSWELQKIECYQKDPTSR